jgi:hypothetical protein
MKWKYFLYTGILQRNEAENMEKIKIIVFKMGGKLGKNENWRLGTEESEVTYKIKYLGVIMNSRRKRGKK